MVFGRFVQRDEHSIGFEVPDFDRTEALVIDPVIETSSFLGGSNEDQARAMAVGADGSIYLTGQTDSLDFPTQNPIQAVPPAGALPYEVWVAKISADGQTLEYAT